MPNPVADTGTWVVNGANDFGQSQNAQWTAQFRNNFNWPISAYPAGSYGYSVTPAESGRDEEATPVTTTVEYPAGLGTSVTANFTNNTNPSSSVSLQQIGGEGQPLTWKSNNGVWINGNGQVASGGTNIDANVVFNNAVTATNPIIADQATITLTPKSLRPQSVWYTVSASGNTGENNGTLTTQVPYTLTDDENKNIFAISPNQIAGYKGTAAGPNPDQGYTGSGYSTAVGGWGCKMDTTAIPVAQPSKGSLVTNATNNLITLSQNYLPLGITANVKDAYFNHNGIIWHYHNGLVDNDGKGIYIQGYVNAYIGGSIQAQGNGVGALSSGNQGDLTKDKYLVAGIYSDSNSNTGLTSVGPATAPSGAGTGSGGGVGATNTHATAAIGLFGSKVNSSGNVASTDPYSQTVAPADITVTLTLVPGTSSGQN